MQRPEAGRRCAAAGYDPARRLPRSPGMTTYLVEYADGRRTRTERTTRRAEAWKRARKLVRRGPRNRAFARVRIEGETEPLARWLNVGGSPHRR